MYYRPGHMLPPYPVHTRRAKVRRFIHCAQGVIVLGVFLLVGVVW